MSRLSKRTGGQYGLENDSLSLNSNRSALDTAMFRKSNGNGCSVGGILGRSMRRNAKAAGNLCLGDPKLTVNLISRDAMADSVKRRLSSLERRIYSRDHMTRLPLGTR
jgi:hypothetical protein